MKPLTELLRLLKSLKALQGPYEALRPYKVIEKPLKGLVRFFIGLSNALEVPALLEATLKRIWMPLCAQVPCFRPQEEHFRRRHPGAE